MPSLSSFPLSTLADIERLEAEKTFGERCSARSVYDVFAQSAARYPDQTALTMIMTGEAGEVPREVKFSRASRALPISFTRSRVRIQVLRSYFPI